MGVGRTKSLHLQIRKKRLTILRSYRRRETMYVCWVGDGRWIGWRGQREGSSCYGGEDPSEAGVETKEITKNQRPMVPTVPVFTMLSIFSSVYACSQTSYMKPL